MNCSGSPALIAALGPGVSNESEFAKEGTAAHEALAKCNEHDVETWELAGEVFNGVEATAEMLEAVEVGVRTCKSLITPATSVFVEYGISHPKLPNFYGTVDFATVTSSLLNVVDYKHGAGIAVEVEDNSQLKYYAYGLLLKHPSVRRVVLRIVQPRAHHPDGPVRRWETTADAICEWAEDHLLPAMRKAESSKDLDAGSWCRFCPAKLVCPLLSGLFEAATTIDPKAVVSMSNDALGRDYRYIEAVKMRLRAIEDEVFKRLQNGQAVAGTKLVHKKANRVFKENAELVFQSRFGTEAYVPASLKSPAELEKLGPYAKELVKEYCYTPQSGYTVALESDKRLGVKVQTASEVFAQAVEGMK